VDHRRTALVLVDLMPRVVSQPLAPRPGSAVVAAARRLASDFRAVQAAVVAIRVERPNVVEQPPGSELVEGVVMPGDLVVVKCTIGGFHNTGLHERLQERGIDTLVMAGIATNLGVESTARAASDHGYELRFVEDAMAALTAEEHEAAINLNFPRFGSVLSAAQVRFG
jgi:nicotinamidase-related amidase